MGAPYIYDISRLRVEQTTRTRFQKVFIFVLTMCVIFCIYMQVDGIIFGKIFFVLFFCLQLELRHYLFCVSSFLVYYLDKHKQQVLLYGIVDLFSVTAPTRQQRK